MRVMTQRVYPDEPAWALQEGPEWVVVNPNGAQEQRWIQKLWVIRDDRKACYETDFGPASDYPDATPILYPSFGEETVASLQWLAERDRHDDKWAKRRRELLAGSTLIADILRQEEEKIAVKLNKSTIGPYVTKQRTDTPNEALNRRYKERRDDARGYRNY